MTRLWFPVRHSDHGTPAHAAARSAQMECLELLIRNGANLGARDHKMKTVLFVAKRKLTEKQVQRLLQFTGSVHAAGTMLKACLFDIL